MTGRLLKLTLPISGSSLRLRTPMIMIWELLHVRPFSLAFNLKRAKSLVRTGHCQAQIGVQGFCTSYNMIGLCFPEPHQTCFLYIWFSHSWVQFWYTKLWLVTTLCISSFILHSTQNPLYFIGRLKYEIINFQMWQIHIIYHSIRSEAPCQVPVCSIPQVRNANLQIRFSHNSSQQRGWQTFSDVPRCNVTELWCIMWSSRLPYIILYRISEFITDLPYSYIIENTKLCRKTWKFNLNMENTFGNHFTNKIHVNGGSKHPIPNSHMK